MIDINVNSNGEKMSPKKELVVPDTSIASVYNIENFFSFIKYFSLADMIKKSNESLQEMNNGVCILVNTSKLLIGDCHWNFNSLLNEMNVFNNLPDKMVSSHVAQFINKLKKSVDTNSKETFVHLLKFNSGSDLEMINESSENLNKRLIQYALSTKSKTSEISKSLSKLYNLEDNILGRTDKTYFIRIICLTGAPSTPVEIKNFKSIMSVYTTNTIARSALVNFLFLENDFYFQKFIRGSDEINEFADFKDDDDSLLKSTRKLNYLLKVYESEEAECKSLSDKVLNFGRSYFNLKGANSDSQLHTNLQEFVNQFDNAVKVYIDFNEAVYNNIMALKRKETRSDQVAILKSDINDVITQNLITKAHDKVKSCFSDFYATKGMKNLYINEIIPEIKGFKDSLEKFQKKIKLSGKNKAKINL